MTSVGAFNADDGHALAGDLGGTPLFDDESGVGILQKPALVTPEQGPGDDAARVAVGMMGVKFFVELALAAEALELPVERVLDLDGRGEFVCKSFYRLPGQLRVEFFVRRHTGNFMSKKAGSQKCQQ